MKAVIRIELIDPEKGIAADQLSAEAPTLDMLKDTVTRTVLLQMTDLLRHVFETPKFVKLLTKPEEKHEPATKPAARPGSKPGSKPAAKSKPEPAPAGNPGG